MTKEIMLAANETTDDNMRKLLMQAEIVLQHLEYCMVQPGASITITVEHDEGHKATAKLYDHAALVQSLVDALKYFQSEL